MFWESFVSALLGATVAYAAVRRGPTRFRNHRLALATGPAAGFLGGLVAYAVLGAGHLPVVLAAGLLVSVVLLSLLIDTGTMNAGERAGGRRVDGLLH